MRAKKVSGFISVMISLVMLLVLFTGCQGYKKGNVNLPAEYVDLFAGNSYVKFEMHSRTEEVGASAVNDDYELRVEYAAYNEQEIHVFGKIILTEELKTKLSEESRDVSSLSWGAGEDLLARDIVDSEKYHTVNDYKELRADYLEHVGWTTYGGVGGYLNEDHSVLIFDVVKKFEGSLDSVDKFSLAVFGLTDNGERGYDPEVREYLSDKLAIVSWESRGYKG